MEVCVYEYLIKNKLEDIESREPTTDVTEFPQITL